MSNFTDAVYDPTATSPQNLSVSLSGVSNQIVLDTAGTYGGQTVIGIAYNPLSSPVGTLVSLSAFDGTSFRVDEGFDGVDIALILANRQSSTVPVLTGTTVQNVSAATDAGSDPETRRLAHLGYI